MKAMLLAAGKGERMRPLTLQRPKPLLEVHGKPLIIWHIERLLAIGVREFVINVSWLGEQIMNHCGDGSQWSSTITYSEEQAPLETAGGIIRALEHLGTTPFLVINADIWTDYPLQSLRNKTLPPAGAHLVLVDNPPHNRDGDFSLRGDMVILKHDRAFTFSGIGLYHPAFFASFPEGKRPLRPLLESAIREHRLFGEHYAGIWTDVGTPERLAALNEQTP